MLLHLNGFIPGYPQQYVTSTNLYSWVKRNKVAENFCRRKERNFKASAWASSSKIRGVNCSATMPAPNKPNWGVFLQSKPFVNIISFIHATLHYMLRNSMHESLYHNRVFRLNTAWFLETIRIHSLSQCHPAFWMEHIGRHVRVLNSQYFWVKMSHVQQSSISTWEAIWAQWVFYHFQRICIGHTVS